MLDNLGNVSLAFFMWLAFMACSPAEESGEEITDVIVYGSTSGSRNSGHSGLRKMQEKPSIMDFPGYPPGGSYCREPGFDRYGKEGSDRLAFPGILTSGCNEQIPGR